MMNNFQNWNAFSNSGEPYLKSFEPATKALQAIAAETSEYSKKTTEAARSYFEKFTAVKNFEDAAKLQNEFLSASYKEFMKDSSKFGELYRDYLTAIFPAVATTTEKKTSKTPAASAE